MKSSRIRTMAPILVMILALQACGGGGGGRNGSVDDGSTDGGGGGGSGTGSGATGYQSNWGPDGSPAEGGWSYNIFDVNLSDGLVPSISGNSFDAGTAGLRGQAGERNF